MPENHQLIKSFKGKQENLSFVFGHDGETGPGPTFPSLTWIKLGKISMRQLLPGIGE